VTVPRWIRFALLASLLTLAAARSGRASLLSLTVISGIEGSDGSVVLPEGIAQETLSGSTQAQMLAPSLFDPGEGYPLALTVRITNISDAEILFPESLPGVSVLTGVFGVDGYTSKINVASGGAAGKSGDPGTEGAVSRTVLDLTEDLVAESSPASGSHGGGGGAATGVADNWLSVTGASGLELATYLAGIRLAPGEWLDLPRFVVLDSFHRSDASARIALGFDLPTFSSGGVNVTTGAWTGAFVAPNPDQGGPPYADAPEPGALPLLGAVGLAGTLARRRA
jgi:hypothetical protein